MSKKQTLEWYIDMGVDELIAEQAIDRFAIAEIKQHTKTPQLVQQKETMPKNNIIVTPPKELMQASRKIADDCKTLAELKEAVVNFEGLAIKNTATNTVFADGNPDAEVMIIGEAPGASEDEAGIPFCGMSGQLLDQMLAAIGLERSKNLYISNILFWRPPGNRRPTTAEIDICTPFVEKHIALIKPKILILAGASAVNSMLHLDKPIGELRGEFYQYENQYLDHPIKTTVIFHPAYLLRQSSQKKLSWKDLLMIEDEIAA